MFQTSSNTHTHTKEPCPKRVTAAKTSNYKNKNIKNVIFNKHIDNCHAFLDVDLG